MDKNNRRVVFAGHLFLFLTKRVLLHLSKACLHVALRSFQQGGTAEALRSAGICVRDVAEITGFPEILDGRVKSLHPMIHGAVLGMRDNPDHINQMLALKIEPIDLVVCNFYPFEKVVSLQSSHNVCLEHIDIGGPALIRAAAKNYQSVTVIVDPVDYSCVQDSLTSEKGWTSLEERQRFATKAYAVTASYDAAVAAWFSVQAGQPFPQNITFSGSLKTTMRYGENPHQAAAIYHYGSHVPGVMCADQIQERAYLITMSTMPMRRLNWLQNLKSRHA